MIRNINSSKYRTFNDCHGIIVIVWKVSVAGVCSSVEKAHAMIRVYILDN